MFPPCGESNPRLHSGKFDSFGIKLRNSSGFLSLRLMPQEPTQQQLELLRDTIFANRKVEAIKLYRQFNDCDLKEAKQRIEILHAELRTRHPEKFAPQSKVPIFILIVVI